MRELERPVARVYRRLKVQRFLTALLWSQVIALAVVAGVLAGEKLLARNLAGPEWAPYAAACGLGLLLAALVAIATGPSRLDAAAAIDRVFHLNERVSTALTLSGDLRATPAGRALIADATRKLAEIDVASEFGLRPPRRAWVILIPASALAVVLFAPAALPTIGQAKAGPTLDLKAVAKRTLELNKKIASQQQKIDKEAFPEAAKLLAKVEKKTEELAKAPPAAKDRLMLELNALSDALKDRQKQLGSPDKMKRQLQQLKEMGKQGPADQLAKDLAKGDFKKAADQLEKLQEKLKSGKITEAEKKALKEQLGEMAKKLAQLANQEERKKQLEEARKNGGISQKQYEREMQKIAEQSQNLQKLSQLANQLSKAHDALEKGDMKKAAESMGLSEKQLQEMAKQLEEMQALDSAMTDVQEAKEGMNGDDMNQLGDDLNSLGMGGFGRRRGNGNGLGRGRGEGDRPEAPTETATYKTKVDQQLKKGKAVATGFTTPSKNLKGESVIDIQGEIDAAAGSSADALSNQRIPKSLEKHVRSYYDQLNKPQ